MYMFLTAIDCAWGVWQEWSACSTDCGNGTHTRQRIQSTLAQHGGANCTGDATETGTCNVLDGLRAKVSDQRQKIVQLKRQLNQSKLNINGVIHLNFMKCV